MVSCHLIGAVISLQRPTYIDRPMNSSHSDWLMLTIGMLCSSLNFSSKARLNNFVVSHIVPKPIS